MIKDSEENIILFVNTSSRYSLYPNRSGGGSEGHEMEDTVIGSELKEK